VSRRQEVAVELRCWRNRKVLLYKSTLVDHVLRFHIESAFVVSAMKRNFGNPICVIDNKRNGTVNAIYDIPTDGHPWLLVAIKFHNKLLKGTRDHFIKTFYGVSNVPAGPLIWGKKP